MEMEEIESLTDMSIQVGKNFMDRGVKYFIGTGVKEKDHLAELLLFLNEVLIAKIRFR